MENGDIFRQNSLVPAHLATFLLSIGYLIYWVELYFINTREGTTSWLATILFFAFCLWLFRGAARKFAVTIGEFIAAFQASNLKTKGLTVVGIALSLSILACIGYAATLPIHLPQEYDALNYHLTLPRQHLILQSFRHIGWSSADLFLLPVDLALAPYWFATSLPNKIPQLLFVVGIGAVAARLAARLSVNKHQSMGLVLLAILGSHGLTIQMGTAMIDLVIAYLFIAFLDSWLSGAVGMASIELGFFFWSKPFVPIQLTLIVILLLLMIILLNQVGISVSGWGFVDAVTSGSFEKYKNDLKRIAAGFVVVSILVGAPFVIKSMHYAGTPLYPFAPGLFTTHEEIRENSPYWQSLQRAACSHTAVRNTYGYGRSLAAFTKHFWILAVPDKGTNNRYDYPLGLPYLLFVGPFLILFFTALIKRALPILPLFVVVYWLTWWMGSQQSRFLYVPLLLIFIVVGSAWKGQPYLLMGCLMLALLFVLISTFRSHQHAYFMPTEKIMRDKDLNLLRMNEDYSAHQRSDVIVLEFHDAAYAKFPFTVKKESLPFAVIPPA